jgi:tRNA pseudouridine32 synthase / 23S rRNA pseudouridine746 synthase
MQNRDGVNASVVVVPSNVAKDTTLIDFFCARFASISRETWLQRFAEGKVLRARDARVASAQERAHANDRLHYFRDVPNEAAIPVAAKILYRDERILVADKPHFLPVMPSGRYAKETLLARLQRDTGMQTLAPAHRIDRDTAGLVLFTIDPKVRDAYQQLFRERKVEKTYEAIAPYRDDLVLPTTYRSRLERSERFMQAEEVEGETNAQTRIELIEHNGVWARYRLQPITGARHQLRAQMNALGIPIRNDRIYPELKPIDADDFDAPLQLIARSLSYIDPITNTEQRFESTFKLLPIQDGQ